MSAAGASPSGFSNGATPTGATPTGLTPNGTAPKFFRKPVKSDPLRPRNKKPVRKQLSDYPAASQQPNPRQTSAGKNGIVPQQPPHAVPNQAYSSNNGGWTYPPQGEIMEFPLVTTVRQLREGMKHHILRFSSNKAVDPANPDDFTRPVSLHRRNPQQLPVGKFKDEDVVMGEEVDDKEREKYELAKLEKEEKRAADLAQIAPSLSTATKKNASYKLGKTTQVRHINMNEQDQKEANNRYEEALPWHLEDAENSQTWMGIYEAALSETHVALVPKDNKYYMLPVEKWYKFTSKNHFKTMTTEEAEAAMNKKVKEPRWVMEQNAQFKEAREKGTASRAGLFKVKGESASFKNANKGETNDMDDLDYDEMDFQDDEEHQTVEREQDEDTKDAEDRVKRDQLKANLFGEADELAADKELEEEEREAELDKSLGRELQKALVKREKNMMYDASDDEEFSSSSDEDSEEKKQLKEEKRKKEEEANKKLKTDSKVASGTSTKGTNTPLGRPPKNPDLKKAMSLKRPGSPNLSASEGSGNESGRKKHKFKHSSQSLNPSSTPGVAGQPSSSQPSLGQRKASIVKSNVNSDKMGKITSGAPRPSPSDGGEDTEMSDAGGSRKKSIKLRMSSNANGGSAPGSRAGSPLPNRARGGSAAGSRAGSPPGAGNRTPASSRELDFSAAEIHAAIPPDGLIASDLIDHFKVKTYSPQAQRDFIVLVKSVSIMGPDKKLKPKPGAGAA